MSKEKSTTQQQRRVVSSTTKTIVRTNGKSTSTSSEETVELGFRHAIIFAVFAVVMAGIIQSMKYGQTQLQQALLRHQFNVTIVDDFMKDPDLIRRVNNDALWRACDWITSTKGERDIRFWYYPENDPVNVFEELAVKIFRDTPYWEDAVSFEYWCNIIEEGSPTFGETMQAPWHTDRDEDVLAQEKKFVTPLMGSVFYGFNESFDGGEFHMVDSVPYLLGTRQRSDNDECHPSQNMCLTNPLLFHTNDARDHMRVEAKYNRLLYANVTHFHKVDKVRRGKRYSLAVNANHWKPYKVERAPTDEEMVEMAKGISNEDHVDPRNTGLFA